VQSREVGEEPCSTVVPLGRRTWGGRAPSKKPLRIGGRGGKRPAAALGPAGSSQQNLCGLHRNGCTLYQRNNDSTKKKKKKRKRKKKKKKKANDVCRPVKSESRVLRIECPVPREEIEASARITRSPGPFVRRMAHYSLERQARGGVRK